jgi:hypothetical protein
VQCAIADDCPPGGEGTTKNGALRTRSMKHRLTSGAAKPGCGPTTTKRDDYLQEYVPTLTAGLLIDAAFFAKPRRHRRWPQGPRAPARRPMLRARSMHCDQISRTTGASRIDECGSLPQVLTAIAARKLFWQHVLSEHSEVPLSEW